MAAGTSAGGRRSGMYARITTIEGSRDRMYDPTRHVQEHVLPRLSQMKGFRGFVALSSMQGGKVQGMSLWATGFAMRASDEAVGPIREEAAEAAGGTVASVEEFVVSVFEAPSTGPVQ